MRQVVKWVAIGIAAVAVIAGLVVGYVADTFDPNDYKAGIVEAVQRKTGRTLELKGDLALSLYPSIGAKLGAASLTEPEGSRPFASVESAVVSVKVLPLLSKQVIVDAIVVRGLRLNLERDRSGKMNFDDLTGAGTAAKPEAKSDAPVKVDIARVEISDAEVTFSDRSAGTRYALSDLFLTTGRVAPGVETPVELRARIASEKDRARVDTRLKTRLTFDLERKVYRLAGLELSATGNAGGLSALDARLSGDIEARTASGEYLTSGLVAAVSAKRPDGEISVKLDAPALALAREKVEGGKLAVEVRRSDKGGKLTAKVTVGSVGGVYSALKAGPLDAAIEMQGEGRGYKAQLSGALTANLESRTGGLTFSGRIDDSTVSGKAAVTRYSPLALSFSLDADALDADRLMGKAQRAEKTAAKQAQAAGGEKSDDRIDLSALEGVDATGSIRIGRLTLLNLKSSEVRAAIKVAGGRLDIAPIAAQLYEGTLGGSLSAHAADNPVFSVRQTLSGVAVGPLLRDAAQIDTLEGKGTVQVDLTTRGASVDALKKALNGTAAVSLADGSVKGVDIAGAIRAARNRVQQLRGKPVQSASRTEKTDFTELKASFKVKNGVARNDDLSIKSPLLRLEGAGDIDIGNDRMDYVLKATVVATSKGQGGRDAQDLAGLTVPVKLTGALDSPQWSIDVAGMVTELAKSRLKDEILKRAPAAGKPAAKGGIEDAIKDRLKGILNR